MRRIAGAAALSIVLIESGGIALAQGMPPSILAPPPAPPVPSPRNAADTGRYRAIAIAALRVDDGDRPLAIAVQRRTDSFGTPAGRLSPVPRIQPATIGYDARPRTRITQYRIENSFPLNDRLVVTAGWGGVKVSNRHANIAGDGRTDRLSAHDWFVPQTRIAYRPTQGLTLSMAYRETMRAYDGPGTTGALGLTRPDFVNLRATLRPETTARIRADAQWTRDDLHLALGAYRATIRDPLWFAERSYAPTNAASATLSGIDAIADLRLSRRLSGSLRYSQAAGESVTGQALREREVGVSGTWTAGAWRATLRGVHASGGPIAPRRAMRVEAAIDYAATGVAGQPLYLSLRRTDPGLTLGSRLTEDQAGARATARATDRAQATTLGATMLW